MVASVLLPLRRLIECFRADADDAGLNSTVQHRNASVLYRQSALVSRLKAPSLITKSHSWKVLAARSHTINQVCDHKGSVSVVRCVGDDIGEVAFKCIPAGRAQEIANQIAAEDRARTCLPAHPLLVKPLAVKQEEHGTYMVSQFAGDSVDKLLETAWAGLSKARRIQRCRDMLACMLVALQHLRQLPNPQMYRDFKLDNICYDSKWHLFRLIDFGLLTSTSKADFHAGYTITYLDPALAGQFEGAFILSSSEAQEAATTPQLDVWTLALTALRFIWRQLPAQLNYNNFKGEFKDADYLNSLSSWDPAKCAELKLIREANPQAADFLEQGLQRCPEDRITLEQAMQHPFVAEEVAAVQQRVQELASTCAKQQEMILELYPKSNACNADATTSAAIHTTGVPAARQDSNCVRTIKSRSSCAGSAHGSFVVCSVWASANSSSSGGPELANEQVQKQPAAADMGDSARARVEKKGNGTASATAAVNDGCCSCAGVVHNVMAPVGCCGGWFKHWMPVAPPVAGKHGSNLL